MGRRCKEIVHQLLALNAFLVVLQKGSDVLQLLVLLYFLWLESLEVFFWDVGEDHGGFEVFVLLLVQEQAVDDSGLLVPGELGEL